MTLYEYNIGSTPKLVTGNVTWNSNGSLGSLVIADAFNPADAQSCAYTYDDLARLASVGCGTTWGQTFSYDAFGNISKTGSGSFASTYYPIVGESGSPTNNQEQTVSSCAPAYDANGNLTTDCTFIPSNTYAWDADANLVGINSGAITITFDAFDRAVEEDNTGTYKEILYSPIGKLAVMSHQTATNIFLPLPGGEQATYTNSTIRFRHYDWLGSARFESNESEQEYADLAYAPFGEPYSIKGAPTTPYISFTGQNQDTMSGLYDFLFREYNPGQGRWLSPDPSGLSAVDMTNPQSWNRYAYVANNPLAIVDPTGLYPCPVPNSPVCQPGFNFLAYFISFNSWDEFNFVTWTPYQSGSEYGFIEAGIPREVSTNDYHDCYFNFSPCAPPQPANNGLTVSAGNTVTTPWYKNPCIQKALAKGAATAGLDAIGLIPEGGAAAAAFSLFNGAAGVSNGTNILGRVALGGALISTAASVSDVSGPNGGANSFAAFQTGVNALGIGKSLFEAIPVAGQVIAGASVVLDLVGTGMEIADCH